MKEINSQQSRKLNRQGDIRIVWALFAKDVLEAIKNKNTITVILVSMFMVFFYSSVMPGLSNLDEPPVLRMFAADNSGLESLLATDQNIKLYTYSSEQEMKKYLANSETPELGLVIPAGFNQAVKNGESPELQGFVMRWVSEQDALKLQAIAESEIAAVSGQNVTVNLAGNQVDLLPDSGGLSDSAGFGMAFVLIMIGIIMIPHLMLEEKQNRTIEALVVSPASMAHIVIGKGLAGLFYCSLGGIVVLIVNHALIVHWWLAILTFLTGALFTVSLGLWLGVKIDSRAQLSLWGWIVIIPLIFPVAFSLLRGFLPDALVNTFSIIPTAVTYQLTKLSFANPIPLGKTLLLLFWVLFAAGIGFASTIWLLRRRDREINDLSAALQKVTPLQNTRKKIAQFASQLGRSIRLEKSQRDIKSQLSSDEINARPRSGLRNTLSMIAIMASKDMLEAIKNKLIMSILAGTLFILIAGTALPLLINSSVLPDLVIYDQGPSSILKGLENTTNLQAIMADSVLDMKTRIAGSTDLVLGVIFPENIDENLKAGLPVELQAFYPHWVDARALSERETFIAEQLSSLFKSKISLNVAGNAVYPVVDSFGQPLMIIFNIIVVILVIGMSLVPLLLIEEKDAKTLNYLLASPANMLQVIAGKALVGLCYSLLPILLIVIFYQHLFVHWGVLVLAVLLTSTLGVVVGLLLGILTDTYSTVGIWATLLLFILIGSGIIKMFAAQNLPVTLINILNWSPGTAMLQLFSIAQAGQFAVNMLWLDVSAMLIAILLICAIIYWRIRRIESQ